MINQLQRSIPIRIVFQKIKQISEKMLIVILKRVRTGPYSALAGLGQTKPSVLPRFSYD